PPKPLPEHGLHLLRERRVVRLHVGLSDDLADRLLRLLVLLQLGVRLLYPLQRRLPGHAPEVGVAQDRRVRLDRFRVPHAAPERTFLQQAGGDERLLQFGDLLGRDRSHQRVVGVVLGRNLNLRRQPTQRPGAERRIHFDFADRRMHVDFADRRPSTRRTDPRWDDRVAQRIEDRRLPLGDLGGGSHFDGLAEFLGEFFGPRPLELDLVLRQAGPPAGVKERLLEPPILSFGPAPFPFELIGAGTFATTRLRPLQPRGELADFFEERPVDLLQFARWASGRPYRTGSAEKVI